MLWINSPYETLTFCEVWPNKDKFWDDYGALGFSVGDKDLTVNTQLDRVYFLLLAKYGNNPIANSDVGQFKLKIFATIGAYWGTYNKKMKIQEKLRDLTEEDILTGAKQVYNHALNPNSEPSTASLQELEYINDQNTASHKKSKMEAYSILWSIIHADYTREFLDRFKKCFAVFVDKMPAPFYISDKDYIDNL